MNFRFEKSGEVGHLTFEGELTIEHADYVREALMISLNNTDFVVMDFMNVTSMDSYCLRLFCVACNASTASGKQLMMTGIKEGIFKPVLHEPGNNSGFSGKKNFCKDGVSGLQAGCELKRLLSLMPAGLKKGNLSIQNQGA